MLFKSIPYFSRKDKPKLRGMFHIELCINFLIIFVIFHWIAILRMDIKKVNFLLLKTRLSV